MTPAGNDATRQHAQPRQLTRHRVAQLLANGPSGASQALVNALVDATTSKSPARAKSLGQPRRPGGMHVDRGGRLPSSGLAQRPHAVEPGILWKPQLGHCIADNTFPAVSASAAD